MTLISMIHSDFMLWFVLASLWWTWHVSAILEDEHQLRPQSANRQSLGAFSWLVIDIWKPRLTWVVPTMHRSSYIIYRSRPVSNTPPWSLHELLPPVLNWVFILNPFNDVQFHGSVSRNKYFPPPAALGYDVLLQH